MTTKGPEPSIFTAACMIINSIDPTAQADVNTMLLARITATQVVIINHRGQKYSVPLGTAKAAAQAQAKPTTTIKTSTTQPAKTVKKASRTPPTTTAKRTN